MVERELRSLIRSIITESAAPIANISPVDLGYSLYADYDIVDREAWLNGLARDLRAVSGRFPEAAPYADLFEAAATVRPVPGGRTKLARSLQLPERALSSWERESSRRTKTLRQLFSAAFGFVRPALERVAAGDERYVEYLGPNLQRLGAALAAVDPTELKTSASMGRSLEAIASGRVKITSLLKRELRSAVDVTPGGWGAVIEQYLESLD